MRTAGFSVPSDANTAYWEEAQALFQGATPPMCHTVHSYPYACNSSYVVYTLCVCVCVCACCIVHSWIVHCGLCVSAALCVRLLYVLLQEQSSSSTAPRWETASKWTAATSPRLSCGRRVSASRVSPVCASHHLWLSTLYLSYSCTLLRLHAARTRLPSSHTATAHTCCSYVPAARLQVRAKYEERLQQAKEVGVKLEEAEEERMRLRIELQYASMISHTVLQLPTLHTVL